MTTRTSPTIVLITLHNAFHGSTTTTVSQYGRLDARQVRNAERRLCRSSTCQCLRISSALVGDIALHLEPDSDGVIVWPRYYQDTASDDAEYNAIWAAALDADRIGRGAPTGDRP